MARTFTNPTNGYTVEVGIKSSIAVLFFGMFYLLYKGLWGHVLIWAIAGLGLSIAMGVPIPGIITSFIYAFTIQGIVANKYLNQGWKEGWSYNPTSSAKTSVWEAEEARREVEKSEYKYNPTAAPETKKCPECAEEIKYEARKCKHCGSAV